MGIAAEAAGVVAAAQRVGSALHRGDGNGGPGADDGRRWLVVTVNRPPDEVAPGGAVPAQLAALGDRVETRVSAAPGGRGTELAARLREPEPSGVSGAVQRVAGADPRQEVRTALREAKSVLETGEVLQPDRPSSTHETPLNAPLRLASVLGRGEGRL